MLDPIVVRILAAAIAVAYVVGVLVTGRRGSCPVSRRAEFRVQDNPPNVIQHLWEVTFVLPNLYPFAVALVPSWTYGTVLNFAFPFDSLAQVLALALWGLGGLLAVRSVRVLGRYMVVQIGVQKDHELITAGPYARIRHPAYVGILSMLGGLVLLFLSYVLLLFLVVAVVIANYRARKEERLLASEAGLGATYRAYVARTGRFVPRIRPRG